MRSRLVHQLRGQLRALSGAGTVCTGRCDRPVLGRDVLVFAESTRYLLAPWWSLVLAVTTPVGRQPMDQPPQIRAGNGTPHGTPIGIDVVPRYMTIKFCCQGFEAEGRRDELTRVLFGRSDAVGDRSLVSLDFVRPIQFLSSAQ